ncbi:MAG: tryptophan 2,3-dioxygenase [Candidatus Kapabacteria bacterium]|nr:tryptophan 2,3-dioxygenase [Candidatus Kapabacteria bacterium]
MIRYGDYLQLEKILDAQYPESDKHGQHAHEEMLFIITHQTFELWFKQVLCELGSVIDILGRDYVPEADIATCTARVQRTNRIMEHLVNQFTLIETMTPGEFMDFRGFLNPASGFQSAQWRILERSMGLPEDKRVLRNYREALPEHERELLERVTQGPTFFDVVERWLSKTPFLETDGYAFWDSYRDAVRNMFQHDRDEVMRLAKADGNDPTDAIAQVDRNEAGFHALFDATTYEELRTSGARRMSQRATLAALFIATYRHYPLLQGPYRFIDAVVELDRLVSLWRFRHTLMVGRMIGMRIGTGGSSGYDYLMATAVKQRVFDDLTSLTSFLIPSSHTPALPDNIAARLQFVNEAR